MMMKMPNINLQLYKNIFNEVYYPFLLDYKHRYEIYYGGAGSGKSYFVAQKIVMKALKSKRKVLVIRKVDATQKDSCWQLILDILTKFRLLQYCKINKVGYCRQIKCFEVFICQMFLLSVREPQVLRRQASPQWQAKASRCLSETSALQERL